MIIDACYDAHRYAGQLSKEYSDGAEYLSNEYNDAMMFYGIEQVGGAYYIPPACCIWTKNKINVSPDLNGMVQLDAKEIHYAIVQHLMSLPAQYLQDTEMEKRLECMAEVCNEKIRSSMPLQQNSMKEYLDIHINWLHYCYFMKQPPREESIQQLLNTSHVYGSFQIKKIKLNKGACKYINRWLQSQLSILSSLECQTALLFSLWKARSIICPVHETLEPKVNDIGSALQEKEILSNVLCSIPVPDPNSRPKQAHYFSIWVTQASKLFDDKTVVEASDLIIDAFLAHIIRKEIKLETEMVDTKLLMSILEH